VSTIADGLKWNGGKAVITVSWSRRATSDSASALHLGYCILDYFISEEVLE